MSGIGVGKAYPRRDEYRRLATTAPISQRRDVGVQQQQQPSHGQPAPETLLKTGWELICVLEAFKMHYVDKPHPRMSFFRRSLLRLVRCLRMHGRHLHCEILFGFKHRQTQKEMLLGCGVDWENPVYIRPRDPSIYVKDSSWEFIAFMSKAEQDGQEKMVRMWEKALSLRGRPFNWWGFVWNFTFGRCCSPCAYNAHGRAFFCSELDVHIKAAALEEYRDIQAHRCIPSHNYEMLREYNRNRTPFVIPGFSMVNGLLCVQEQIDRLV